MTTRSGVRALAGFGLATAVGISGCGAAPSGGAGSGGTPKDEVIAAFESLAQSSGVGLTLTVDSTQADLAKINASRPPEEQQPASTVKENAALLADGSVAVTAGSGTYSMSVLFKGSSLVDVVAADDVVYLRADTRKIDEASDLDLTSFESFFEGTPPSIRQPVTAIFDGKWVSLDLARTAQVLKKEGVAGDFGVPSPDRAQGTALLQSLRNSFEADAEVTEIDGGYRVKAPAAKIAQAVQDDLGALAGDDWAKDIRQATGDLPAKDVTFDVFLDDGKVSGINFDLVQFLDPAVPDAHLVLQADVDPEAEVAQAPRGAVEIRIKAVVNALSSLFEMDGKP